MNTMPKIERTTNGLLVIRLPNISVNWDIEWDRALQRGGYPRYRWLNQSWVEKLFPKPDGKEGIESVDISLLGYKQRWKTQQAIDYVAKRRLRVVHPRHLLAVGETYHSSPKPADLGLGKDQDTFGLICLRERTIVDPGSLLPRPERSMFAISWCNGPAGSFFVNCEMERSKYFFYAVLGQVH